MPRHMPYNLGFTCPNLDRTTYKEIRDVCQRRNVDANIVINYYGEVMRVLREHAEYLTEEGHAALAKLAEAFKLQHPECITRI